MAKKLTLTAFISLLFMGLYQTTLAYEAVEVTNGGTVNGVVKLQGKFPEVKSLTITKNEDFCGGTTPDPTYAISASGEIKNVLITIEGIEKGKKAEPVKDVVLDNNKCTFKPHVQAVTVGTRLTVMNSDPILHNTHTYLDQKKTVFNLALPIQGQKINKPLRRPGMMNAKCDAGHTWMSAYIFVSEHPYYSVTGEDGKFKIADIPPGTYKLKAWHEALGELEKEVTVSEKGEISVDFNFQAR